MTEQHQTAHGAISIRLGFRGLNTSQPSGQGDKRRIVSLRKRHERDFHKYDEWI
jgi:hypothetical protein